jgi:hypothetical protein
MTNRSPQADRRYLSAIQFLQETTHDALAYRLGDLINAAAAYLGRADPHDHIPRYAGTRAGLLGRVVALFFDESGNPPDYWPDVTYFLKAVRSCTVELGPCVGSCAAEVSHDFLDWFTVTLEQDFNAAPLLDAVHHALERAGSDRILLGHGAWPDRAFVTGLDRGGDAPDHPVPYSPDEEEIVRRLRGSSEVQGAAKRVRTRALAQWVVQTVGRRDIERVLAELDLESRKAEWTFFGLLPKVGGRRRDKRADARDRWLYQRCRKGDTYKAVMFQLNRLAPRKGWRKLDSPQAVQQAVDRYIGRNHLDPLAPR